MIKIALFEPEIPQNTGNIGRLTVGSGCSLILAGKLGFSLEDKYMKRAGLDYWKHVDLQIIDTLDEFFTIYPKDEYTYAFLTKFAEKPYTEIPADNPEKLIIILGKETAGLPDFVKEKYPDMLYKIPITDKVRSLNVANAAAITVYDVLRRCGFGGLK